MTAAEWLARARAVTDGATPEPWETFESSTLTFGCLGVDDSSGGMVLWHHDHGIVGGLAADAAFIAASRTMLPAAVAAIEAVLAVHRPVWSAHDNGYHCDECGADLTDATPDCPTVAAITAALDPS